MPAFLELEETVGRFWHRFAGDTRSWPRHAAAAVTLEEVGPVLAVCFRAFGGEATVQLVSAQARTSAHRLRLRQWIGLGEEKLAQPSRDPAAVRLPPVLDLLPLAELNRDLYVWLAAAMAVMPLAPIFEADPLRRDLAVLAHAERLTADVLAAFPGLALRHRRLCAALLAERRRGSLPRVEAEIEARVVALLMRGADLPDDACRAPLPQAAPAGYLPMLPVPLWPEPEIFAESPRRGDVDDPAATDGRQTEDGGRHAARRESTAKRQEDRAPFILNRFEKILSMAEMVDVDRPGDDGDEHDPAGADELDELTLGEKKGRPASRFRFDLDLPPEALDDGALVATLTYPEWDWRRGALMKDHCRVVAGPAPEAEVEATPSPATAKLVRRVRRQFEMLRPRRERLRAQIDGDELDLDSVVRHRTDLAAGGEGCSRIHMASRPLHHELAVALLVDVSLSTDAWFDDLRVLDVEKDALGVLSEGLAVCGDRHAIFTFTSRRRDWVRVETVKDFDEPTSPAVRRRIAALKPGWYTRMGAAVRHASARLAERPERHRLLLVLTDGKPNDVDHYEGHFALEDSRRAVIEARSDGVRVFAVTIDRDAKAYVPAIFGNAGHAVVPSIGRLPAALPAIYRTLVG